MNHTFTKARMLQFAGYRRAGYLEAIMAARVKEDEVYITLTDQDFNRIRRDYSIRGPGWHLKELLGKFGIFSKAGCKCNAFAHQMDTWGPDVCEERIDEIASWLKEEAGRRRLPYLDMAGRLLVRRAIANARRETASAKSQPQV